MIYIYFNGDSLHGIDNVLEYRKIMVYAFGNHDYKVLYVSLFQFRKCGFMVFWNDGHFI